MCQTIYPSKINGKLNAPSSKSEMQRVVAACLLANGKSIIFNPSFCYDATVSLKVAEDAGAKIKRHSNFIEIQGGLSLQTNHFHFGESALALRLFAPILSLSGSECILNGDLSLQKRPINIISEALSNFGVGCCMTNNSLPMQLKGELFGNSSVINANVSSQVLSGLLMALPCVKDDSMLIVQNLRSKPYIELTLEVLHRFGINVDINSDLSEFFIKGNQKYLPQKYEIEGDWSSMSFMLVAASIHGSITIKGLNKFSKQSDIEIIEVLKKVGSDIFWDKNTLNIRKNTHNAFNFDASDCPDLFPPLVVLAAFCNGISQVKGVSRLEHKESNRGVVLKNEFSKLGVNINIENDTMIIHGGIPKGGVVNSNNDHRIAMASAIMAIGAEDKIVIQDSECVSKSYPEFFKDLLSIQHFDK